MTAEIKLVELGRSSRGYSVQGYVIQALPAHVVVDGVVLDLAAAGQALRQALSRLRTSTRYAAVAVAGPSVITQVIEMEAGLERRRDGLEDPDGGGSIHSLSTG